MFFSYLQQYCRDKKQDRELYAQAFGSHFQEQPSFTIERLVYRALSEEKLSINLVSFKRSFGGGLASKQSLVLARLETIIPGSEAGDCFFKA